ncbi:MAG: hypothetical protein ACRDQD_30150, partial [Nocardioidaceae bacterium]
VRAPTQMYADLAAPDRAGGPGSTPSWGFVGWANLDLNQGPLPYQNCQALTMGPGWSPWPRIHLRFRTG